MKRAVFALAGLLIMGSLATAQLSQFTFDERGPVIGKLYQLGLQNKAENIPVFIEGLKQKDPAVREAAMAQLVFTHDESAVKPVIGAMKDPSRVVRRLAIATLDRIGSKEAIPALTEALTYYPPEVKQWYNRRTKETVRNFEYLRPEEHFNRIAAALALHRMGSEAGKAAVLECLRDPASKNSEAMAIQACMDMNITEAVPDLLRIVRGWEFFGEDSSGFVALRALYYLGDDAHRDEIVRVAIEKSEAPGMHAPIWSLALLVKFGDKSIADNFKHNINKAEEHEQQFEDLLGFQKYKPDGAADLVMKKIIPAKEMDAKTGRINWEREYKIFQMGCETLAVLQDKTVVPQIKDWIARYSKPDDWYFNRLWLGWTLAKLEDKQGVEDLTKALGHEDASVRRLAAALLEKLGDKASAGALAKAIKKETESNTFEAMKKAIASFGPVPADVAALKTPAEPDMPKDTYGKPRMVVFSFDDCATPGAMERFTGLMEELASQNIRWAFTIYYAPLSRYDWEYDRTLVQRCFDRGCEVECHTLYHNPDGRSVDSSTDEQIRGNVVACNDWLRAHIIGLDNIYRWKGGGGGFHRPGDPDRSWRDIAEILPEAAFATDLDGWWSQPLTVRDAAGAEKIIQAPKTTGDFDLFAPPYHLDPIHDKEMKFADTGKPHLVSPHGLGDLRYAWDAEDPNERIKAFVASFDYWYFNAPSNVMFVGGHDWPNAPMPDRQGNEKHWAILGGAIKQILSNQNRYPLTRSVTDLEMVYVFRKQMDPSEVIGRKANLQTKTK